jgi:hypothetical protein
MVGSPICSCLIRSTGHNLELVFSIWNERLSWGMEPYLVCYLQVDSIWIKLDNRTGYWCLMENCLVWRESSRTFWSQKVLCCIECRNSKNNLGFHIPYKWSCFQIRTYSEISWVRTYLFLGKQFNPQHHLNAKYLFRRSSNWNIPE